MSIDPTKLTTAFGISPAQKMAIDKQKQSSQPFEHIFDDSVNSLKNIENSQKNIIAIMRMEHIQLLQGLFSEEDGSDSSNYFTGILSSHRLNQLTVQRSQIIDKYYSAKPTPQLQSIEQQPKQIGQMIDHVAEKISLAPELIHSVVATESAYNPTAVSHAGAQGLMQLMPETAQELGVQDSFDPLQNLLGGSRYLKQLLEKYDGDLDHALAAYNWGQGNVDRYGLENMPEETRNYLTKIKTLLETKSA